jgi:hypothetical protein
VAIHGDPAGQNDPKVGPIFLKAVCVPPRCGYDCTVAVRGRRITSAWIG